MRFRLDIYIWPPLMGTPTETRTSHHETPQEAITHLNSQTEPYFAAVLQRDSLKGWTPCDWDGHDVSRDWPQRRGSNGNHPAYVAVMSEWEELKAEVLRELETPKGARKGSIAIADRILRERHPDVALAHRLGAEAIGADPARI